MENVVRSPKLQEHVQKVKKVLSMVVKYIMDTERLSKTVSGLGKRHVKYGAQVKYARVIIFNDFFVSFP